MKLAIVRQRYTPYGGAERFVARALGALERAGMEVTLIARNWEGWGARRVLRVNPPYVGSWWRDVSFARRAAAAWRREGFDLVQSHERIPGCDVYRAGDGVHRRWLELRRAVSGRLGNLAVALNPHHRYLCEAEKRMFEHPRLRAVICNSRMVQEEVRRGFRIDPAKLHVIYNGVDLEHFHPRHRDALRAGARAELGCGGAETVFLFVGSGFFRKGLASAIQALGMRHAPAWRLVVAGNDRHMKRYAAFARRCGVADRVQFLGGRKDVRPLYAAADCFVLPSRYDPFPNTALEALAMGLPAIVSSRCGAAEIIESGTNGWVCPPDDVRRLAERMDEAEALARTGRAGEAARNTAEGLGLDAMAKQLTALYAGLHADAGTTMPQ
jgi:UDP-glucose:(heptosyl)LPS alpha-1,3-glucosyltransferase